ncbi:response regulator [Halobacteriaceae archaeon GCM10025711]
MNDTTATPSVLVVEDDPGLVDLYARWLADYDVRTATTGADALALVEAESFDVVLLDRQLPDRSGRSVLADIRQMNCDCMVTMVTAVRPDVDIVEMRFDDYLVKPVDREELLDTVDRLSRRMTYDEQVNQLYAQCSKLGVLEAEHGRDRLAGSDEYESLVRRIDELHDRTDQLVTSFEDHDFDDVFRDIPSS